MSWKSKRWLWVALTVSVLLSLAWEFSPLPDASGRLEALNGQVIGFTSVDVPLTDVEQKVFGGASVIKRVYRGGGVAFLLIVIDGTRDRHSVHDPTYCFRGAGWTEVGGADIPVAGGEGRWVRLRKNGRESEVIYWFSDGVRRHASPVRYWCQTTLRRVSLGALGEEPVLVVAQPFGERAVDWRRVLGVFVPLQEI